MEKAATKPTKKTKQQTKPLAKKRKTDWEAVERDYRTGHFTSRELSEKHQVSHSLIARNAKKNGWTQDLAEAVRQATNAKLIDDLVNQEVHKSSQKVHTTIQVAAEVNTNLILSHRADLLEMKQVKKLLLEQIKQATVHSVDLAKVVEMVRNPDENGIDRANDALRKAMGRSALVDDLKKLADVDEKVRKGEREAFSIDSTQQKEADAFTTLLLKISTGNSSSLQPVQQDPAHNED